MINITSLRNVAIVIDIVLVMWFYRLKWYRLCSATLACVIFASMI